MKKIPYIEAGIQKELDKAGNTIILNTHNGVFHADDIMATVTLKLFFKLLDKKIKIKVVRSMDPSVWVKSTFVYDTGGMYDFKKLRFDHHQTGGSGVRESGVSYAAFGLIWKHFGPSVCALYVEEKTGKLITRKDAVRQAEIIDKKMVAHFDCNDNGQMSYKQLFDDTVPFTLDSYFEMCKIGMSGRTDDSKKMHKNFDAVFMKLVTETESVLKNVLQYAMQKDIDEQSGLKMYTKSKDKRIIICDRFYGFNFGKLPEPLVTVYPDSRSGWAAKNVRIDENDFNGRFYFPESWRGKIDKEIEQVTGIQHARFCHNSGFMIAADTKEAVLAMVHKAFEMQGIK